MVKYGYEVDDYLKKGNVKSYEHLFDRIKVNLYHNTYKIKAINSSKEMDIIDVIALI